MSDYSKESDASLVQCTLNGDTNAFSALVQSYQKLIWKIAYSYAKNKEDMEDIAQNAFRSAFEKLKTLENPTKFKSWLCQIAVNESKNFTQRRRPDENVGGDGELEDLESDNSRPVEEAERNECSQLLERYLAELDEPIKSIVRFRYWGELKYREIAEALNLTRDKVSDDLKKGRELLRSKLQRDGYILEDILAQIPPAPPIPADFIPRIVGQIQAPPIKKSPPWHNIKRTVPWVSVLVLAILLILALLPQPEQSFEIVQLFNRVQSMELTPIYRTYDERRGLHQLHSSWQEVRQAITDPSVRYEGVEGFISSRPVEQGEQMFRVFLDGTEKLATYRLVTEDTVNQFPSSQFLGGAFNPDDPLLWSSLVRLEHLQLETADVRDDLYTTGHDFINKDNHLEKSEIDFAKHLGFKLKRNPDTDFWVLERIFLGPIFKSGKILTLCWSRLTSASAYRLEMRVNRSKWQPIYQGTDNFFRYTPLRDGRYEFRVGPLPSDNESVANAKTNDRKGLEERPSNVRAIAIGTTDSFPQTQNEKTADVQLPSPDKWQFKSSLFNWRYDGWKPLNYVNRIGSRRTETEIIESTDILQNPDGTVTVNDKLDTANLYLMHEFSPDFTYPFTVQIRLKTDFIRDSIIGALPVVTCAIDKRVSIQPVLHLNGISTWQHKGLYPIDTSVFHTYTIVVNADRSADIYIDNNFSTPALQISKDETNYHPASRIEIGSPTRAISQITVDYVCYTKGRVLELACIPDWLEGEVDLHEMTPLAFFSPLPEALAENITSNSEPSNNVSPEVPSPTITATTSSPALRVVNTGSGHGIYSKTGSTDDEIAAIYGETIATSGNTKGVVGITHSPGSATGSAVGVYGWAVSKTATGGSTIGVLGRTRSKPVDGADTSVGVYGWADVSSGRTYGVWGESNSSTDHVSGVYGVNTAKTGITRGVIGVANSTTGGTAGVLGVAPNSGAVRGVMGVCDSKEGYAIYADGNLAVAPGYAASTIVQTSRGNEKMYSLASSEHWFEDFGEGQLINGKAYIELDTLFLETVTINLEHPMKVFIQLHDDCNGVFVKRGNTGFDVIESNNGKSNAHFTYRVVAKRKGFETKRMEPYDLP